MLQVLNGSTPRPTLSLLCIQETLVVILFLFTLFITHIPDDSGNVFQWKALFLPLLLVMLVWQTKDAKFHFWSFLSTKRQLLLAVALGVLILLPLASLVYSLNKQYGFQKWLGLILDVLPTTLAFSWMLLTWSAYRTRVFVSTCSVFGVALTILLLTHGAFKYDDTLNFYGWTHVGYGRFMGFTLLVSIFTLLRTRSRLFMGMLAEATMMIATGLILSGLRAALLGSLSIILIYLVYGIMKKEFERNNLLYVASALAIVLLLLPILQSSMPEPFERYKNFVSSIFSASSADAPIEARKSAFNLSLSMTRERPLLGSGFGGFNRTHVPDHTVEMQYPHNLILEFVVELGIPGFILCGVLLWMILWGCSRVDASVLSIALYALWLSMFSYPLHSQKLLWVTLAFFALSDERAIHFRSFLRSSQ